MLSRRKHKFKCCGAGVLACDNSNMGLWQDKEGEGGPAGFSFQTKPPWTFLFGAALGQEWGCGALGKIGRDASRGKNVAPHEQKCGGGAFGGSCGGRGRPPYNNLYIFPHNPEIGLPV
jgi:hypothetical protein